MSEVLFACIEGDHNLSMLLQTVSPRLQHLIQPIMIANGETTYHMFHSLSNAKANTDLEVGLYASIPLPLMQPTQALDKSICGRRNFALTVSGG